MVKPNLKKFFSDYNHIALAYSGGVDSAFLLSFCSLNGVDFTAYFVKSPFQPERELECAKSFAKQCNVRMCILENDTLANQDILRNGADRCYYCKRSIMGLISDAAKHDGYDIIIDGTNASDSETDRPGMRVLKEMNILSPLKICGINKTDVRRMAKDAGIPFWDKPSYSCLATRVSTGETITAAALNKIDAAEKFLFSKGYRDFRVRLKQNTATLQFVDEELTRAISEESEIISNLKYSFDYIVIDTVPRKRGL